MSFREFHDGEIYHIYNRGVDKRIIFSDDLDFKRFQKGLFVYNGSNDDERHTFEERFLYKNVSAQQFVNVIDYCLMPNHFHLLLEQEIESGISEFMRRLGIGYTHYFNKRNERSGRLFQSKFQSKHINKESYLDRISTYIHQNQIALMNKKRSTKSVQEFLVTYQWSSLFDRLQNQNVKWIHTDTSINPIKLLSEASQTQCLWD